MPLLDFAILTALTEEFRCLTSLLPAATEVHEGRTWYRTRLQSDHGVNYEIVLAHQDKMGPLDALQLTTAVIDRWDPSHILLTGIAGSFDKDLRLGDVIVSQQVFYYDPAKAAEGGLQYRPEGYPCSVSLIRQAHAISVSLEETEAWRRAAQDSAKSKVDRVVFRNRKRQEDARAALQAHRPSFHVGAVASGSLVITDPAKKKELLRLHGKLLGTEMEGAGVMHAAFFIGEAPKSAIVIKGISDAADKTKAKMDALGVWRELAGENSVRLALALIRRGRLPATLADQFTLDHTMAPISEARSVIVGPAKPGVSFPAFTGLVRPLGPLTRLAIHVTLRTAHHPVPVLEARVRYQSRGQEVDHVAQPGPRVVFATNDPVDPQPVALYMLTPEPPEAIGVEVSSGSSTKYADWKLPE